ncbi:hypothetical protein HDU96_010442 [Phlyctochytrium bullatum]|nr:hypothetical protein HDU96_010442 [Phlyctochytrium bullatum]
MPAICSLSKEALRTVLLDVFPNDLIALASVNRHLHRAVPSCVDYALAKRHIHTLEHLHRSGVDVGPIYYDHPLLFNHTVAEFAIFQIDESRAEDVWGDGWKPKGQGEGQREKAIRLHRVRALRESIQKREWLISDPANLTRPTGRDASFGDWNILIRAVRMAAIMQSIDLLTDFSVVFPRAVSFNLNTDLFRVFLWASAESGFRDGLELIRKHHHVLSDYEDSDVLLYEACQSDQVQIVKLLLDEGVSANVLSRNGEEPLLHLAVKNNNVEILRLLQQHGADLQRRYYGLSALHLAANMGFPEVLKLLLEFGANIEARVGEDITPLPIAERDLPPVYFRMLCDPIPNADEVDAYEMTALALACWRPLQTIRCEGKIHKRDKAVRILLDAGAQVNALTGRGETPLHFAVEQGRPVAARLLLDAGADITIKNEENHSALQMLPEEIQWNKEWEEVLDRFVERGADLHEVGTNEMTAWEKLSAVAEEHPELLEWMARHGELDEKALEEGA